MLEPEDQSNLLEKTVILRAMVEQNTVIIACLMASLGHEVTFSKKDIDSVTKTFEVEMDVKTSDHELIAVHMKLKLR